MRWILTFALILLVAPITVQANSFSDVPRSHMAYEAITYLADQGLLEGRSDGRFHPDATITRAEAAKVLAENRNLTAPSSYSVSAPDLPTSHWGYSYVNALAYNNILEGDRRGIRPDSPISRAEMATTMDRTYSYRSPGSFQNFQDVPFRHWAYHPVNTLAFNGITTQGGSFYWPSNSVTRAEFSLFVYRTIR
ncbi:S-layer homology domain-containing protein [Paenalkalicoccus suaedae]|uniref:S-layer homology domain-containing protein n=1 Tax=Paenalkalicoccus suaedae TaxID=2592382 RepID=A0A859FHV2_9BACI|nr:S-layer homology domain-containing protein [Paenalkalicoccus suaedae]QKS72390.1 S-layer homology domain-containing protein [Paenalkalicoccus suaedae]